MKNLMLNTTKGSSSLSSLQAVLFDMDGTLVQIHQAGRMLVLNETLADFGLPPLTSLDTVEKFWFTSERYAMIDSWGIERNVFWRAFDNERLLQLQIDNTYAFEDVGATLNYLNAIGQRMAVVSNSAHISLDLKLNLLSQCIEPDNFEIVVSCHDDVAASKPCPEGIWFALEKMQLKPENVVLIGDSLDDIGAARNAGVRVIIVDRGQIDTIHQKMAQDGLDFEFEVVPTLHDLPELLGLGKVPLGPFSLVAEHSSSEEAA